MKPKNEASSRASRPAAWAVFWGEAEPLKPHRIRYWLNNNGRSAEPEVFGAKVRAVCEHYALKRSHRAKRASIWPRPTRRVLFRPSRDSIQRFRCAPD
jgi:hypothetical protein